MWLGVTVLQDREEHRSAVKNQMPLITEGLKKKTDEKDNEVGTK